MKDNHTPELWGEGNEYPTISQLEHIINCRASYYKNCGDRAVECAESDLLGECLDAIRGAVAISPLWLYSNEAHGENAADEGNALCIMDNKFQAILAKRKGEL